MLQCYSVCLLTLTPCVVLPPLMCHAASTGTPCRAWWWSSSRRRCRPATTWPTTWPAPSASPQTSPSPQPRWALGNYAPGTLTGAPDSAATSALGTYQQHNIATVPSSSLTSYLGSIKYYGLIKYYLFNNAISWVKNCSLWHNYDYKYCLENVMNCSGLASPSLSSTCPRSTLWTAGRVDIYIYTQ